MSISELGDIAINALKTGNTLQHEVREVLKHGSTEDAKQVIITAVEELKLWSEAEIMDSGDVSLRKQTNNLINDISRICKEKIGHSLRCKAKKPCHKYVMEIYNEPAPKVKPEPAAHTPIETLPDTNEQIRHLVKTRPVSIMTEMFSVYGDNPNLLKDIFVEAKDLLDKEG